MACKEQEFCNAKYMKFTDMVDYFNFFKMFFRNLSYDPILAISLDAMFQISYITTSEYVKFK